MIKERMLELLLLREYKPRMDSVKMTLMERKLRLNIDLEPYYNRLEELENEFLGQYAPDSTSKE